MPILTGPGVDVLEQVSMDRSKMRSVVGALNRVWVNRELKLPSCDNAVFEVLKNLWVSFSEVVPQRSLVSEDIERLGIEVLHP